MKRLGKSLLVALLLAAPRSALAQPDAGPPSTSDAPRGDAGPIPDADSSPSRDTPAPAPTSPAPDTATPDTATPDTATPDTATPASSPESAGAAREPEEDGPGSDAPGSDGVGSDGVRSEAPGSADGAGSADTGSEDTGSEDTGSEDTGSEDTGSEDTGSEDTGSGEGAGSDASLTFGARIGGEYRHRFVALSDFPLAPLPRDPSGESAEYGANLWGEQWLRLRGELALRPVLKLVGELDLLWGVAYGDLARGMGPAAWTREEYGYPGIRLRQLYLEWRTPIGLIRAGQQAFSWGLGIISNGGETAPPFGDYRFGDLVRRLLFATRPAGEDSPFTVAVAGDWVAYDLIADYAGRDDLAFQGLLAAFYEEGDDRAGGYVAYRDQVDALGETLQVFVGDLFASLHFDEPSGGRVRAAFEIAYVRGTTTVPRTVAFPSQDVEQLLAVAQLGHLSRHLEVMLEGGYASGDSNPEDGFQRRGTFDPDHRVGLILFPEVLAAVSARTAGLASSEELFGRPARGAALIPTNGGVSGAFYFFPYAKWRPLHWLEARVGAVVAWTTVDNVDLFEQRARSANVNYRGGDASRRDLGLELDGALLASGEVAEGVRLSGGVEGGVLFPGNAFDDAEGRAMDPVGMLRLRLGIGY